MNAASEMHSGAIPAPDVATVLSVDGLCVSVATEAGLKPLVNDLSFSLRRGETLAIAGESGSGKSITSLAIMGLLPPPAVRVTGGSVRLGETDLLALPEGRMRALRGSRVAMIFQEPMTSLNPVMTIGTQLVEAIRAHESMSRAKARAAALAALKSVRISQPDERLDQYPHQLSGGMRQRVMIAMALSCKPSLLIADEPTTALDVTIQAQILQLIRQLQQELGMAVIFITHDMGVVAEVADRVLVMYRGDKVEEGESGNVFAAPQHAYTRALLSAVPKLGAMRGTDLPRQFDLLRADGTVAPSTVLESSPADTRPAGAAPILRVKNLVTRFDLRSGLLNRVKRRVHAVEQVSFDLYPGETLALVGESGCGKSTTGRSLLRLVESQSGAIEFGGRNILDLPTSEVQALRRDIQFIFQDPFASLDPRLTVGFSIMEPLLVHKVMGREDAQARVDWLLEKVGLPREHAQRYPHEFSGGQRQRIAIARALVVQPQILVLDEPTSALDVTIQQQILQLLQSLQKARGLSYLLITHDGAVVDAMAHQVLRLEQGRVQSLGSWQAVN